MPKDKSKLPPGITENPDGAYDVRFGYMRHRFYVGVYDNLQEAKRDLEQIRANLPAMLEQGPEFVHRQLKELRAQRREERLKEGITFRKPKGSLRQRIEALEARVQKLETT